MLGLLIFVCLCCGCIICYLRWHFNYWTERNVRGPKPSLLKGTFPKTYAAECNLMEELHAIYLNYKASERYVGVFTARTPKLFILDPELATAILTTHFRHFRDNESSKWSNAKIEQLRTSSPFVCTGEAWKEKRSELSPMLTANRLRVCYAATQASASQMLKFLKSQENHRIDAKALASRFTAQFIANFIWGIEAHAFDMEVESTIYHMATVMLQQAGQCVSYYARTAAFPFLRRLWPMRFFPAKSDRFFQHLTDASLELRMQTAAAAAATTAESTKHSDVIHHLLQLKLRKFLSAQQIAGHATTILIDGFETAAMLIAHCLLLLSRDERIQQKLRVELLAAGEDITFDALNELHYLDQCIQETLRLFPPLPTLFKLCTEPISFENSDGSWLTLNTNDIVYISSYSFHRDAEFYVNPEVFWPERFDEDIGGVRRFQDMGVFLPFGDGPRMCPGVKLGLAEAKLAVAAIVREFSLKCSENTRKDNKIAVDSFLLCLDGGIELVVNHISVGETRN